jgi:hypothetical protein
MDFEVSVETQNAENRITKMLNTLQTVPVPDELSLWQTLDMKRKKADTEIFVGGTTAFTMIYPRGRPVFVRKKRSVRPTGIRKPRWVGAGARTQAPGSKRPILLPILFDRLCARMSDMMQRVVKW